MATNLKNLSQKIKLSKETTENLISECSISRKKYILTQVFSAIKQGKNKNIACLELSNGNEKLASVYLQEYQNILKKDNNIVKEVANNLGLIYYSNNKNYQETKSKINNLYDKLIKDIKLENEELKNRLEQKNKEIELLKRLNKKLIKEKESVEF